MTRTRLAADGAATVVVAAPEQTPNRARVKMRGHRDTGTGLLFVAPAGLLFVAFIGIPLIAVGLLSFFSWDMLSSPRFIGFGNYSRLLHDPVTLVAFRNTAIFAIVTVLLHMIVALPLAVAVNNVGSRALGYFVKTTVFFPMLVSWAACALIMKYVFDPDIGFFNYYLSLIGVHPPRWFLDNSLALPAIIGIDLWRSLGFTFIILLAGLQMIPKQLYEAAAVDGATGFKKFWFITIPMLSPTILFTLIVSVMGAFQIVDPMLIITQGGPGTSTLSAVQQIYYTAFRDFQMGYASTISVALAVVITLFTLVQLRVSRKWVTYDR